MRTDAAMLASKHLADVVQLSALLRDGLMVQVPVKVKSDLERFVQIVSDMNRPELVLAMQRIATAYELNA